MDLSLVAEEEKPWAKGLAKQITVRLQKGAMGHVHEDYQVCLAPAMKKVVDVDPDAQDPDSWHALQMDGDYVDIHMEEDKGDNY